MTDQFDLRHGLAVAAQVEGLELKLAAILHDAIEDGACTAQDLVDAGLPAEVVELVVGVTRVPGETYFDYISRIVAGAEGPRIMKRGDLRVNLARMDDAHRSLEQRWRDALDRLETCEARS